MQVYQYREKANTFSVPFDWDEDDTNIDYVVDDTVETYFENRQPVGAAWQPSFFGVVNPKQKLGDLGSLVRDDVVMSQKVVDALRPLLQDSVEFLPYETEVGPYYLVNVLDEGEYLDRDKTDCDRRLPNARRRGRQAHRQAHSGAGRAGV